MDKVYDCYILILFFVYRIESQIPAKCSRNPFHTAVKGSHVVGEHGPFVNVFISLVVPYSVNGADWVIVSLDVPVVQVTTDFLIPVIVGTHSLLAEHVGIIEFCGGLRCGILITFSVCRFWIFFRTSSQYGSSQ